MEAFFWLLGFGVVGVVIWGLAQGQANVQRAENAIIRARNRRGFNPNDIYASRFDPNGFAIDANSNKVLLIRKSDDQEIRFDNLVSVEVLLDNATITSTNRLSQVGGAVVGGALFGVAGALVGGLSGSSRTSDGIRKISVKLIIDDFNSPNHEVVFLDWSHSKKGLSPDNQVVKDALKEAEKWHARFSTIIKRLDSAQRISAADNHNAPRVECPFCAELIKPNAQVCPFCRKDLPERPKTTLPKPEPPSTDDSLQDIPSPSIQPEPLATLSVRKELMTEQVSVPRRKEKELKRKTKDRSGLRIFAVFAVILSGLIIYYVSQIEFSTSKVAETLSSGPSIESSKINRTGKEPSDTKVLNSDRELIRIAQAFLYELGYDPGPIDGILGPKTRKAIRDFQEAKYRETDGKVDETLIRLLETSVRNGEIIVQAKGSPSVSPRKETVRTKRFLSFRNEAERATNSLSCPTPKITPGDSDFGALYGCIVGVGETVKFFINEQRGTDKIRNVKFMWNDWYKDIGYGLHVDREKAKEFVEALGELYSPKIKYNLVDIFFENDSKILESDSFRFEYRFTRGPAIEERLIIVTEK